MSWQFVAEHLVSFAFGVLFGLGLASRGYRIVRKGGRDGDDG